MSFLCSYCESVLNTGSRFCVVCSRPVTSDNHDGKLAVKHKTRLTNQTLRLNQIELPKKVSYKSLRKDFTGRRLAHNFIVDSSPIFLIALSVTLLFNYLHITPNIIKEIPVLKAYFPSNETTVNLKNPTTIKPDTPKLPKPTKKKVKKLSNRHR